METPSEQPSHRSTNSFVLRQLLAAAFAYRKRTLIAFALVILAKLSAIAVPLTLKAIIDRMSAMQAGASVVAVPVLLVIGYALLRFLGTFFSEVRDMVFARVTRSTESGFLLRVFSHLHGLSTRFHSKGRIGGLTRDVERGTAGVGFLIGVGLFSILPTLVEIAGVIVVMTANYNLWFTAIILITFVVYTTFTVVFTERRAIYQRALNRLDSSANGRLVDSLMNHETVKYYTNERYEHVTFNGILHKWVDLGVKNQKALSALHIGQSGIIALGVTSVMLLATTNVAHRTMSVGDLVLVNAYVIQICMPLNALGFIFREARDAIIKAERMLRLLKEVPDIRDRPGAKELTDVRGEVRFEHVDFSYDPSRQILWDVSFSIPAGSTVAVVGGSGSGKSTLARLLFRFYEVDKGQVLIDGVDIRDVTQQSLRRNVGIVPQDTILFNETIAYNIGYSKPDASLEEVVEAAKAASLHDFISSLPEQYNTQVGERGIMLSGGEKQRIAIARALLRNPRIMVFDEATSALDSRSERAIQDELVRLSQTRTTLIIAHRLSSIVDADEILVLEHGRIAERGKHDVLLEKGGLYAQLWRLQRQQQEVEHTERGMAMQEFDVSSMLEDLLGRIEAAAEEKGVSVFCSVTSDIARVVGDEANVRQALWTLIVHGVSATPKAGRMEVRTEQAGGVIRVHLVHGNAVVTPGEGTLEPVALRALVEKLGGILDSRVDGDLMTVILELPVSTMTVRQAYLDSASDKPSATGQVESAQGGLETKPASALITTPSLPLGGVRLLIVESVSGLGERQESLLDAQGASVTAFTAPQAARDWLFSVARADWPDAIIFNVEEGDESHYEFISRLRRLESDQGLSIGERLPAIAVTSGYDDAERVRCLLAGFQLQVTLDAAPRELPNMVRQLVTVRKEIAHQSVGV